MMSSTLGAIGIGTCALWSIVSFAIAYMHFRMMYLFRGQQNRIYIASGATVFGLITGYFAITGMLN